MAKEKLIPTLIRLTEAQHKHCEEQGGIAAFIRLLIMRDMQTKQESPAMRFNDNLGQFIQGRRNK